VGLYFIIIDLGNRIMVRVKPRLGIKTDHPALGAEPSLYCAGINIDNVNTATVFPKACATSS